MIVGIHRGSVVWLLYKQSVHQWESATNNKQ